MTEIKETKAEQKPSFADTVQMAVECGLVARETQEEKPKPKTPDKCADHISRTKILDVIESTMARYKGKVVLAMEEVRDIIKAITTAVKE